MREARNPKYQKRKDCIHFFPIRFKDKGGPLMRMGVREICDVVFRPLTSVDIGNQHFDAGQPVLYLDTAKTSTLEGAATTVYAQGQIGSL